MGAQLPAEQGHALAHPDESVARALSVDRRGAVPVVDDLKFQGIRYVAQADLGPRGVGVLERVGERLLDDPVAVQPAELIRKA